MLLCPWDSPGKNTGVGGSYSLLQGIFLTQGSNPCLLNLLHWQVGSLLLVWPRKPLIPHFIQFSRSVMSNFLRPHELQHTRPPCPSPTPRAYANSCSLSQWCHLTISSSVIPFSCPQSFPASGSFQMSQLFTSGGHPSLNALLKCVLARSPSNKIEIHLLLFSHSEICGMGWAKMLHFCFRTQYCVSFLVLL